MSTHSHTHHSLHGKKLLWTIALNVFITLFQFLGGIISGSLALLTDALHNFSDVVALCISYVAHKLGQKKFTDSKTYGYRRAEIIATLINSATLLIISIFIIVEAFERLASQESIIVNANWVIGLSTLSILINGASVLLVKEGAKTNMNIRSAYLHLFSDMLSSIAVLVGGVVMLYFNIYWVDGVLSILIAIYLIIAGWKLASQSISILMQFAPPNLNLQEIASLINDYPFVKNVHHAHAWQLNDHEIHFEAHVDFEEDISVSEACIRLEKIKKELKDKYSITHCLLQPEFESGCDQELIVQHEYQ